MTVLQRVMVALVLATATPATAKQGSVYAFGDSLLDDGTIFRSTGGTADAGTGPLYSGRNFSNGATAFDAFGQLAGLKVDPANDHAISGVFSGLNSNTPTDYPGTLAQVRAFVTAGGRFAPEDVALVNGGTNEAGVIGRPEAKIPDGLRTPVTVAQVAAYVGSNLSEAVTLLRRAGLRTVFVYNVPLDTEVGRAINAGLAASVARQSDRTIRVHLFDLMGLYAKVSAYPHRYGFASAGGCSKAPACAADPAHLENHYFTVEGLHPTVAGHELIARVLARLHWASWPPPR